MSGPTLAEVVGLSVTGDRPVPAVESLLERRWHGQDRSTPGRPYERPKNIERVLTLDPRWQGRIRYNEFARRPEIDGAEITDGKEAELMLWLDEVYRLDVPISKVATVVNVVAERNSYHPVRDYLDALQWDGVERVPDVLCRYYGGKDHPLYRRISACWMVSSVARIYDPGCKVDSVVILAGNQGVGKSTGLRAMMPDPGWFSDAALDLDHKDALMKIHAGIWWYELAELADVGKKEVEKVKSFISESSDQFRPPYGRRVVTYARSVVFSGTTNAARFLKDPTGSRRFWPVETGGIDIEAIKRDRDQIWAESVVRFRRGDQWYLSRADGRTLQALSDEFQEVDSWEPLIAQFVEDLRGVKFSTSQLFDGPLQLTPDRRHRGHDNRIATILKAMGCQKAGRGPRAFGSPRLWVLPKEGAIDE